MNKTNLHSPKFSKLLAMTDSNHEGEALNAFRMVRRMLAEADVHFADLVKAPPSTWAPSRRPLAGAVKRTPDQELQYLKDRQEQNLAKIEELRATIGTQAHRIRALEEALTVKEKEAKRWKAQAEHLTYELTQRR